MRPLAAVCHLLLACGLALAVAGCYAPSPVSGSLRCGTGGSCPEGYACLGDHTCWKGGETPSAEASGGDPAGFVGHWLFGKLATNTTTCTDGSHNSRSLENDYVDVAKGVTGDLTGSYYCDWELNLAANGQTSTLRPGTTCMTVSNDTATNKPKTQFTWTAQAFTFVRTGGGAVLNAQVSATFLDILNCTANCTGSCTVALSGPLTKAN